MLNALFNIIIAPIIQILEFFFTLFFEITNNHGLAVIGLSIVVTLCTLPLYMVAEQWQEKEREIQENLKPGTKRIKKFFKGDEQYMILTTFYKQNHYHPLMALRSSFSLLIQIPFFIAAYTFLSHLEALKGVSFLFIKDFGNPDATFKIGSFYINVLPIAMTLINCISGALYSKGHGINEKIQIFGCAAVFLLLLYNSPAGLVVYWTMNNIFSLVKNIFYKLKNPKKVLYTILCITAFLLFISTATILRKIKVEFRILVAVFAFCLPVIPFIVKKVSDILERKFSVLDENKKLRFSLFILSAILLAFLAGFQIPSTLMESEPEQYCYVDNYKSPFVFLFNTFFQAAGLFLFWPTCFYALFSSKIKKSFSLIFPILAFVALLNTFAFSGSYGPILPECIFMQPQLFKPTLVSFLLNIAAIAGIIAAVFIIIKKQAKIISYCATIVVAALFMNSFTNCIKINKEFKKMQPPSIKTEIEPVYHLSKTGKNVIVIMQDRLFMPFVEQCFEEKPIFRQKFDGFTFYKNAISFGRYTMIGTPGIFGGYSFTPYEINQRSDETLQEKHNQALLTLPVVFHEAGFSTTVSGLPYENYLEYPIENMYKGYEYVKRAETRGAYSDLWYQQHGIQKVQFLAKDIKRNFIWFSIFKMVSPVFRRTVYHNKYWTSFDSYNDGLPRFVDNYSELDYLPQLTDATSTENSFIMIDNETVHESILLDYPDYIPTGKEATRFGPGKYAKHDHFTTMMAVFNTYEKFFDYLKSIGVYDNTRIIIVSDHGTTVQVPELKNESGSKLKKQNVVATLLVKDFYAHGPVKEDMTFMTNADTPYLATKDIVAGAKNPFTGFPFLVEDKAPFVKIQIAQAQSTRIRKQTSFPVPKDEWFTVHDNIFVKENWAPLFSDGQ
ncbi:YidC/Oxa1 family membrane protein insertase [Treponema succinifaciens]|uniref:YidC/Oxa1 family membrane protein insertase n=1 Tax=Treponema succinifaciens TaxID=167 RepID=UPI00258AB08F|nr:membrane protein insertase YidC [uncultured Treponema sp.]